MKSGLDLKIMRIRKGIKGIQLAQLLNVDQSYISKMENNVRKIPKHIYDKWIKVLSD